MLEQIYRGFRTQPRRLLDVGRSVFILSWTLVVAGIVGRVYAHALSWPGAAPDTATELYPALFAWAIPESMLGFFALVVVAIAGLSAVQQGRRQLEAQADARKTRA